MSLTPSPAVISPRSADAVATGTLLIHAEGENWATDSEVVIYELEELNQDYATANVAWRFVRGYLALGNFVLTGTFFRYLSASWRYGFFFIFPLLVLLGAALAGAFAGLLAPLVVTAAPALAGWIAAVVAAVAALVLAQRRWNFMLALDDWAFARDVARGGRPDVEARLALVSRDVMSRIAATKAEEVLFAAHSFGAIAAVIALAETLGGERAETLGLLTAGSSLLKIALHPAARRLRDAVTRIVTANRPWLDVQSHTDILNFYGTRPAAMIAGRSGPRQNTARVRFRHQLDPATYKAIKRDFFRVHRQFVYGVERRSHYSYHAILCGPEPFAEVVSRGGLRDDWSALSGEAAEVRQ
jgi:hypothetical protein